MHASAAPAALKAALGPSKTAASAPRPGERGRWRAAAGTLSLLLAGFLGAPGAQASGPIYADGDLAPIDAPDGIVNLGDYLVAHSLALGSAAPSPTQLAHGDVFPPAAPDGEITIQDSSLLQRRLLAGSAANLYVKTVDLFTDGPATISAPIDPTATTTLSVDGYTSQGTTVVSNPYAIDQKVL